MSHEWGSGTRVSSASEIILAAIVIIVLTGIVAISTINQFKEPTQEQLNQFNNRYEQELEKNN